MTERFCLRCDWTGETDEPGCPRCGAPLYLMGSTPTPTPTPSAGRPGPFEPPAEVPDTGRSLLDAPNETQDQEERDPPSADTSQRGRWRVITLAVVLTVTVAFGLTRGGEPELERKRSGEEQARADPSPPSSSSPATTSPLSTCSAVTLPPSLPEPGGVAKAPTADYLFQSSLSSSLGTAPDLIEVEHGSSVFTVDARTGTTVLRFAGGRGLALAPTTRVIPGSEYSIELLFRFDFLSRFRKIIDFSDGASDAGLYTLDGCLTFFPKELDALTALGTDAYVQVVLTRDADDRVVAYVNGVRQFAFRDDRGIAEVSGRKTLRFFVDDHTTTGEFSSGSVSQIRLFDQPLTADEVGALACSEVLIASATASCRDAER